MLSVLVRNFLKVCSASFVGLADLAWIRVEKYGARYKSFGAFSLINYVFPFYMWSEHHSADTIVLSLRGIAGILNFFLLMHETWPPRLKRFLPLYWYFTVAFSLPFFAGYMLLLEGFSVFWIINISLALIISLIVLDFRMFLLIFPVGTLCALGLAFLTGVQLDDFKMSNVPFQVLYLIVFSGSVAILFSRNRELIEQEKVDTMKAFGSMIAHEMRTPLSTISLLCKSARQSGDKDKILANIARIFHETSETLVTIDIMLERLKKRTGYFDSHNLEKLKMKQCISEAIERYPFCDSDKPKVHVKDFDFELLGHRDTVVHVLFNLLQNAMYQINKANKGEVFISYLKRDAFNVLLFKDTAAGVDPEILDKLFDAMVSNKPFGTGLGLSFCKDAMEYMGGTIRCRSVLGDFAEFVLEFPEVTGSKIDRFKTIINKRA